MNTSVKPAAPESVKPAKAETIYRTINSFGWEQDDKNVKVRVISGIDGVGSVPKENIIVEFTNNSFDLKIHELKGANYRLRIHPVNKEINGSESKYQVKSNSITVTLVKKEKATWDDLKEKKPMFNPKKTEKEKDEDPQASLMNMMKDMYENGDDEMRKMIAQSWSKAQTEKDKKPL